MKDEEEVGEDGGLSICAAREMAQSPEGVGTLE